MSVPNQKRIKIKKGKVEAPFIQIAIKDYLEAQKNLSPSGLALYVWLSCNKDDYSFEISSEAFKNATGYSKSSYHRAYNDLVEHKYIYYGQRGLEFATRPMIENPYETRNWELEDSELELQNSNNETLASQNRNGKYSEMNTEINNIEIVNKTHKTNNPTQKSYKKDYSYLFNMVGEDGSCQLAETGFVDGGDFYFYSKPKKDQIKTIMANTNFNVEESAFIVDYILK